MFARMHTHTHTRTFNPPGDLCLPVKPKPSSSDRAPLARKVGTLRCDACPLTEETCCWEGRHKPFKLFTTLPSSPGWVATSFHSCCISAGDIKPEQHESYCPRIARESVGTWCPYCTAFFFQEEKKR